MSRDVRGDELRCTLVSDARHVISGPLLAQLQKEIPDKVH